MKFRNLSKKKLKGRKQKKLADSSRRSVYRPRKFRETSPFPRTGSFNQSGASIDIRTYDDTKAKGCDGQ
jgi:hypothetical protein